MACGRLYLQPASEYGHAALEELHQQTANLLSFQPLPTEVFGGQTAFTLAVSFDAAGQAALASAADRIRRHYAKIAFVPASSLALQVIQVPVFHGYALSVSVEFSHPVAAGALAKALAGSHVRIVADATAFPGNVQAVEEEEAQIWCNPSSVFRIQRPAWYRSESDRCGRIIRTADEPLLALDCRR